MENKQRFYNIDFLKFLFIICLCTMHFVRGKANLAHIIHNNVQLNTFAGLLGNCSICFDFFFIILGFFLFYTFDKNMGITDFIKKQFVRFWPMVLLYVIIDLVFVYFVFHMSNHIPYNEVYKLLMIDGIGLTNKFLGITFFVSVFFWGSIFYFYLLKNFSKEIVNILVPLMVVGCYSFLIHAQNGSVSVIDKTWFYVFNGGVMRGIAGIGLGYIINNIYSLIKTYTPTMDKYVIYSLVEGTLLYFIFNNLLFQKLRYNSNFILIIGFVLLFILFLLNRGFVSNFFNNKLWGFMSKYVYSIFITHIFVLRLFRTFWGEHKVFVANNIELNIIGSIACAVIVGIVVYYLVQLPVQNFMKKKLFPEPKE